METGAVELESEKVRAGKPGDVHGAEFRSFWEELETGQWVKQLLQEGYRIPVPKMDRYREPNNATAVKHMDFVREQTAKLVLSGVVRAVSQGPKVREPANSSK